MSWWFKASEAQRLAQIDGGIECGMTSRQIAVASGLDGEDRKTVAWFAQNHLRKIPHKTKFKAQREPAPVRGAVARDRRSYIAGERVNLWGNAEPQDEFALDEVAQ